MWLHGGMVGAQATAAAAAALNRVAVTSTAAAALNRAILRRGPRSADGKDAGFTPFQPVLGLNLNIT